MEPERKGRLEVNASSDRSIADAVIGVGFVVGSSILFAGAIIADAVTRSAETRPAGGSIQMVAFVVAIIFFIVGIRRMSGRNAE